MPQIATSENKFLFFRSSKKGAEGRYYIKPSYKYNYSNFIERAYSRAGDTLGYSKFTNLVKNFNTLYPEVDPDVEFAWTGARTSSPSFFRKLVSVFYRGSY